MNTNTYALRLAAIVFLSGAVLTILFHRLEIKDSPTIIALLVVPLLVYCIASEKLLELSAPGGWSAKFQEIAKQNVNTTATTLTAGLNKLQSVEKESLFKLDEIIPRLEKGKPIGLVLFFGKKNYYDASVVTMHIDKLKPLDQELAIIIIDEDDKRFVCAIDADSFVRLSAKYAKEIIDAIGQRNRAYLLTFPEFVFQGIRDKRTNIDALKKMRHLNTKLLVVLDDKDHPISIVKRDEIIAHLFDNLTA